MAPAASGYVVPRYRADGAAFYHFLHGTVPGHQIDFMYCPEVPQGALRQPHFGHLARLIKYIEPRDDAPCAFAIGNLSRDDVQHSPGHGGLAVIFALRVPGVVDHAGRDMPPYAHGVVAVDRELTYGALLHTVTALARRFLEREDAEARRGDFYRAYVQRMRASPEEAAELLAKAIHDFDDLPTPRRSSLGWDYAADRGDPPAQITLLHDEPMELGMLAHHACTLAALLYRSNIKWTSISTGREIDIAGGTTIRFLPRSEARPNLPGPTFDLDELPDEEEALAALLFGARRRGPFPAVPSKGWREALADLRGIEARSQPVVPPGAFDPDEIEVIVDDEPDAPSDVDDAAATIPVGTPAVGARPLAPPPEATRPPAGGGVSTAGRPAAREDIAADGDHEDSHAAWRAAERAGRTAHRGLIAAVIAVAALVAVAVVIAGLGTHGSPAPSDTDTGDPAPGPDRLVPALAGARGAELAPPPARGGASADAARTMSMPVQGKLAAPGPSIATEGDAGATWQAHQRPDKRSRPGAPKPAAATPSAKELPPPAPSQEPLPDDSKPQPPGPRTFH